MPPPLRGVVLDVNETLFGLEPVAARLAGVGLAGTLDVWFARVLRDGFAVAAAGGFADFPTIATHHLDDLARAAGLDDAGLADQVLAGFEETEVHADVADGLRLLHDAGLRTMALTNGTQRIAQSALERAGLADLVDVVADVSDAGVWKPAPAAYAHAASRLDLAVQELAMVAVHPWDVAGGMRVGMVGGWVARDASSWPPFLADADVMGGGLDDLAQRLLDLTASGRPDVPPPRE